ncbi:MAG TPA: GatB/YqeY domain-containing protein [Anaerolineae bacterium]|nr:GatB/YqeY domain-containing protein [Anaerolineae bacterium]
MSLKERLMEDLKRAMREGDEARKSTIRLVRAAVANAEKAKRSALVEEKGGDLDQLALELKESDFALDDQEILEVIAKEAKRRREAVAEYQKAGRQDLAAKEEAELQILMEYLPRQMSPEEIEAAAREMIAQVGATDMAQMGQVMRPLMAKLKGRADGRLVSEIVRRPLTE